MMTPPSEIVDQLSDAMAVIERHLAPTIEAVHLFGSAVEGGLKPHSDIDLLVTVNNVLDESVRRGLMRDLLDVSVPPGSEGLWRPLEVTVLVKWEVVPWSHPARRELQFGEWLRKDISAGIFEPAMPDHDLAILLTQALQHSLALHGPSAAIFFDCVPEEDFLRALSTTVAQWKSASDWQGDERNVVLALARIWYSAATGKIASKDVAAEWVLKHSSLGGNSVLRAARAAYLGIQEDDLAMCSEQVELWILSVRKAIEELLR